MTSLWNPHFDNVSLWNVLVCIVISIPYSHGSLRPILRGMSIHQKLGLILESKVVQKLSLEKKIFGLLKLLVYLMSPDVI